MFSLPLPRRRAALAVSLLALMPFAAPAVEDLPPIDLRSMLQQLTQLRDSQLAQSKALRSRSYQEAAAAAANPARAMELWEEAVRITQFQGLAKDAAQFKDWKQGDGEALKEREIQTDLHLYFNWLALTLQRGAGQSNHDLFNAVYRHAQEVVAQQQAMDVFLDNLKREKETIKDARRPVSAHDRKEKNTDEAVKRLHDQILNQSLASSAYVQAMKLGDEIAAMAPAKRGRGNGGGGQTAGGDDKGGWEGSPGNVDGIYQQILQPELRAQKDPRVVEYWDAKLRREADQATRNRLTSEIEKFNQQRRPQLLWNRAQEWANIGMKNRAANEMFAVIKMAPPGTDTTAWITELVNLINPPAPAAVAPADLPPAPLPGTSSTSTGTNTATGGATATTVAAPVTSASGVAPRAGAPGSR